MTARRRPIWPALTLAATLLVAAHGEAQVSTTLTEQDRAEILALSAKYGPALLGAAENGQDERASPSRVTPEYVSPSGCEKEHAPSHARALGILAKPTVPVFASRQHAFAGRVAPLLSGS